MIELVDKLFLDLTRGVPDFARRLTFVDGDPRCLLIVEYSGDSEAELAAGVPSRSGRERGECRQDL